MPEIVDIIETNQKAPSLLPWQWLLIILAAIAVIIAIILILRRRKITPTRINSFELAMNNLRELEHSFDTGKKDNQWLILELSLLTRSYLQDQFKNKSIFQTHEEFIKDHDDLASLPAPAQEKIIQYLGDFSDYKYAPDAPIPTEKNKLIQLTESLLRGIDSTIPKDL